MENKLAASSDTEPAEVRQTRSLQEIMELETILLPESGQPYESHISWLEDMVALAKKEDKKVESSFSGIKYIVAPGESLDAVRAHFEGM